MWVKVQLVGLVRLAQFPNSNPEVPAGRSLMEKANIIAAWIAILVGFFAGVIPGLFFHDEEWLGGYSSWPRRLMRLGHVSFFGIAFVNFAFAFTVGHLNLTGDLVKSTSILFIVAQIAMPTICYGASVKKVLRNLFFIPVLSLIIGALALLVAIFQGPKI